MKKIIILFTLIATVISFVCCKEKQPQKETTPPTVPEKVVETYKPVHEVKQIDLKTSGMYNYYPAPKNEVAQALTVSYDNKTPYKPITITYSYKNGDSYTYKISEDFGLWNNEAGRLRVVKDEKNTLWLQGQSKKGNFHEFIFYGDPALNGKKIKPNSYLNSPKGVISYR